MSREDQIRSMLINKRFKRRWRIVNMIGLGFGEDQDVVLHVQSCVRIIQNGVLVVESNDMYVPEAGNEPEHYEGFQWDEGGSWYDRDMKSFIENNANSRVVEVCLFPWGDLFISLENDTIIQVLVDTTTDTEQWRLFVAAEQDQAHIVRYPRGWEE